MIYLDKDSLWNSRDDLVHGCIVFVGNRCRKTDLTDFRCNLGCLLRKDCYRSVPLTVIVVRSSKRSVVENFIVRPGDCEVNIGNCFTALNLNAGITDSNIKTSFLEVDEGESFCSCYEAFERSCKRFVSQYGLIPTWVTGKIN